MDDKTESELQRLQNTPVRFEGTTLSDVRYGEDWIEFEFDPPTRMVFKAPTFLPEEYRMTVDHFEGDFGVMTPEMSELLDNVIGNDVRFDDGVIEYVNLTNDEGVFSDPPVMHIERGDTTLEVDIHALPLKIYNTADSTI